MSITITLTIVAGTLLCVVFYINLLKGLQQRVQHKKWLRRLSYAGTEKALCFSSQVVLQNRILALDGIKRKLLVITTCADKPQTEEMIALDDVICCSVKKTYGYIHNGTTQSKKQKQCLQRVSLQFVLQPDARLLEVPFYNTEENNSPQVEALLHKARYWQTILTKMSRPGLIKRA